MNFDFVIIGSGFGGSVSAMRLSQKGYRVAVLEKGKRWNSGDFPETNWNLRKFIWAPFLRCFGIQSLSLLKGVMVLHGTGVGGGSLVYANTLMEPPADVFSSWKGRSDWHEFLKPFFSTAKKMLGVITNPMLFDAESTLKKLGIALNVESSFHSTEVGIYFDSAPESRPRDPYFSGAGPKRMGCNACAGCMTGCRYDAKNTLDKNYLFFAEKWGARVFPETQAMRIQKLESGYSVETRVSTSFGKNGPTFLAKNVVVSAGVLGTVSLLLENKLTHKTLPLVSPMLGQEVRTNGESLLGATALESDLDFAKGIAIGAAIHPNDHTKIEAVKYPKNSDFMRVLGVPLTGSGNHITRPLRLLLRTLFRFTDIVRLWLVKDWSRSTVILLVMQSLDQKMKLRLGRSFLTFFRKGLVGEASDKRIPAYNPVAQDACVRLSEIVRGVPQNIFTEVVLDTPATAHILGGCVVGESASSGVVDSRFEVFGYPGLFVCDGSVIGSNLAVNPSLTITALAESFASQFPVRDQAQFERNQIHYGQE